MVEQPEGRLPGGLLIQKGWNMLQRLNIMLNGLAIKAAPHMSLVDRFRESMEGVSSWLVVVVISMLPIFELRGGIPAAKALDMQWWEAYIFAVVGNMIPIPFILWLLDPVSSWLSRHSRAMDRFFTWLFTRTRRKHSESFERWREVALTLFVAIPLPITGAWTGAVAAFVFGIPPWVALPFIFLGVLIAGAVVTLATFVAPALVGWQGSVVFFALMAGVLVYIFFKGKKESSGDQPGGEGAEEAGNTALETSGASGRKDGIASEAGVEKGEA